jgi:hypothetical protein
LLLAPRSWRARPLAQARCAEPDESIAIPLPEQATHGSLRRRLARNLTSRSRSPLPAARWASAIGSLQDWLVGQKCQLLVRPGAQCLRRSMSQFQISCRHFSCRTNAKFTGERPLARREDAQSEMVSPAIDMVVGSRSSGATTR